MGYTHIEVRSTNPEKSSFTWDLINNLKKIEERYQDKSGAFSWKLNGVECRVNMVFLVVPVGTNIDKLQDSVQESLPEIGAIVG